MRAWPNYLTTVSVVALLFFLGVIYGDRWEFWGLGEVFTWLRRAPLVLPATGLLALVATIVYFRRGAIAWAIVAAVAFIGSAGLGYVPIWMKGQAESVPPIHDITTDVQDPPLFVDILPLRADAPNPAAYDTEQTAQQLEAFPDLVSLTIPKLRGEAFEIAMAAVKAEGLKVVAAEESEGRIEAYATTPLFAFKDDVVIRLRDGTRGATVIDIRSKSRVGRSDLGFNARRIRALLDRIEEAGGTV